MKSTISLMLMVILVAGCRRETAADRATSEVVELMNRGVSLMGQYEYHAAVNVFEAALKSAPDLNDVKLNLALALFNRARKEDRDLDRSGELLEAVLKNEPENLRAIYIKGILLQHIGQAETATACFEQVVKKRPDDGAAWYLLALCKQRLGLKVEDELRQAIQLRPNLASAYYLLGQSLRKEGENEKAKQYLDKFKELRENPLAETIELPQYNQMGELALARPLTTPKAPPLTKNAYAAQPAQTLFESNVPLLHGVRSSTSAQATAAEPLAFGGAAVGDLNQDGLLDVVLTTGGPDGAGRLVLLRGQTNGGWVEATAGSGLEKIEGAFTCALGDYDNDELMDLCVAGARGTVLLHGQTAGPMVDVTQPTGVGDPSVSTRSALFLDADHDGDLDLLVCLSTPGGLQLWNNNADGTFTNIAVSAGVACAGINAVMVLPGDLDGDRDHDLLVLCEGRPAKVFLNDLLGRYHEMELGEIKLEGDGGGVLQDVNGDGRLDAVVLGGKPTGLRLFLGDGRGHFRADAAFSDVAEATTSWGTPRGFRSVDIDLDGDLDFIVFSADAHLLLNNGLGTFVLRPRFWKASGPHELVGAAVADLNGDYVADLLRLERGAKNQALLWPGTLTPPSTALAILPTGLRGRDKRTRSPASGYGVTLTVRAGWRERSELCTGQSGGFDQSLRPVVFGLGGASQADYAHFLWPDGVAQAETALASGQLHKIAEIQRKISSCPVLFAWNGRRFECITDFAGVGGLGYYAAPGEYAPPQALEHIKIEPGQLRARDGFFELRITEPMEETAYVDQLELVAVDHPTDWRVFPDERLVVSGPPPTHELLVVDKPMFPQQALDPQGRDCTEPLARVDRLYAYEPVLDRRFFGFCRPHTLELNFGDQLAGCAHHEPVYLFINGYLEYPYSQTTYAASQARVGWEPIRIERRTPDGRWQTLVPDAGAFGGLARTMTVNLTGLVNGPDCRLRLTSNLEIYYDQIFLARHVGQDRVRSHPLNLAEAELRRIGFPREYSPDGRMPVIYDYDMMEATAPFHVLRGAYTRYGPVRVLLETFDDQYVLVGPGDEIAVKFAADQLPVLEPGMRRSFILVSHAYCKDMDLYTATPQTLEPLPFRGMSRYPYPPTEHYPRTEAHQRFQATYNTRVID